MYSLTFATVAAAPGLDADAAAATDMRSAQATAPLRCRDNMI
jgi:hypothetical protein